MRHRIRKAKLGRTTEHRTSLLANLVSNLIKHRRIRTTLAKAKAARVVADKMVTLSKKGLAADEPKDGLHYRRIIASRLRCQPRHYFPKAKGRSGADQRKYWRENEDVVRILMEDITPGFEDRQGGYTRVIKLGRRRGDAAEMAYLEWVADGDKPERESKSSKKKSKPKAEEEIAEATEAEDVAEEATAEAEEAAAGEEETSGENEESDSEEPAAEAEEESEEAAKEEPKAESGEESDTDEKSDK
jgi:large subunit ribosomal protein L17